MIGALVMAYGSPASIEDVETYYAHIRRGRAPSPEQVAELVERYESIGGTRALSERTEAQRAAISTALGDGWTVRLGNKHATPFIEDGIAALVEDGVDAIVGVVAAPHYSHASVGEYHARAAAAASSAGIAYGRVDRWYDLDAHVEFLARSLRERLDAAEPNTKVLFSAHSLPERVLRDDPYPDELRQGAALIASRAGLEPWGAWAAVWQSAGRSAEPWRGPDIGTVLAELAETGRSPGVVVVPHGFTAAHLEVRYDLDIVAKARAAELGLAFARTEVVDADPAVMTALATRIAASVP